MGADAAPGHALTAAPLALGMAPGLITRSCFAVAYSVIGASPPHVFSSRPSWRGWWGAWGHGQDSKHMCIVLAHLAVSRDLSRRVEISVQK